ncbi:MAG: YqaE/Pmp3 family membrane protein [Phycisphaerales bacterium]|nr:YqaE/Pmp3 family membrane protein [Phycisphaerales bacterium]
MRYLLAIILPPVAVLLCGRPFLALFNLLLTLCFWIPGAVHALFIVHDHKADQRTERMLRAGVVTT